MKRMRSAFLLAVFLCAASQFAAWAQTTRIDLAKSGDDVQVSMSSTSGPWRVVRSTSPQFNYQAVLLATAASSNPVTDANAALAPTLYFYDASDEGAGEVPADQGQPTQENLYLTSLSPNAGWEGQSITINGSGFSAEPTENQVFFGPIQAVVTGATTTALTVTVPVGVMTGSVLVQVSALTSNSLPFTAAMETAYSGNSFQNISSIVFDDKTTDATSSGHLFFSDMGSGGTADYLYEVMDDYSLTQRTPWNEMKGLAMDPSGNLYCANTTLAANTGLIKKYDAVMHTLTTYTTAKKYSETESVSIVGLAYRPDGIIFAADRYHNSIRKRDPGLLGASDFVTGHTLDLYMGMAMDSAQNLYFTSGGTLYMTPTSGSASVTTVATGFTNASGIAIDESTGNTLILIADRGAGSVYLLNAQTGLKDLVTSGLTSPRAVAFGKDKVTGELYYYVAEATRVLRLPDPKIKLDAAIAAADIRVLISKKQASPDYPCALQRADAQIRIPFTVQGKISNSLTVYAKLYDPPDPSPYVSGAINDNRGFKGSDVSFQSHLSASSIPVPAAAPNGEITLTVAYGYAGDNYYVGFSTDPAFLTDSSKKPMARTGTITAWRRVFVERDKMFMQGGLLKEDAPGLAPDQIYLYNDPNGLQPSLPACANDGSNCFQVVVFDSANPAEGPTAQQANVQYVTPDSGNTRTILTLDRNVVAPPAGAYVHSLQDFSTGKSAGVGVVGSGYYDPQACDYALVMQPGFCEVIYMTSFEEAIPYMEWPSSFSPLTGNVLINISKIWRNPAVAASNTNSNYFHVMGMKNVYASQYLDSLAFTPTDTGNDLSAASGIWEEAIGTYYPAQLISAIEAVSDHELTHNFSLVANVQDTYHCPNAAYSPPADSHDCLMNASPPVYSEVQRFCLSHILTGGDGITDCTGTLSPCNISVRDQSDVLP